MNERIRELADQACVSIVGADRNGVFTLLSDRQKKFALLLIRECLVQIGDAIPDTNCSAASAYKTARIAATSRVKQHFGVEE